MWRVLALLASWLALVACAGPPHRAEFSRGYPLHDCPDALEGQVRLEADAQRIDVADAGALGRRLVVAVTPAGLRAGDRIVWSALTIGSYGGTFRAWDKLQQPKRDQGDEVATVALAPGQLRITRIARGKTDLAGMYSIDVLLIPGGVAVDDTVVRIPQLWHADGTPLPPHEVVAQLLPVRHPPGRRGDEWTCSAEARATLVDQESVRQPFWDLGLASANSARREWLALFDPALGGVRLVFESPAAARSFADWMRATRATQVGKYAVRAFRQSPQSLRALNDREIETIAVGPLGEP